VDGLFVNAGMAVKLAKYKRIWDYSLIFDDRPQFLLYKICCVHFGHHHEIKHLLVGHASGDLKRR